MNLFGGEFPPLRPFQIDTHEQIRQAAREGHKHICVMAPTAAGKTILALNVIKETLAKGNRAMFLCDRKTLISQTSNVAREVGLGFHGIIQADNPMLDLSRSFQIASCQTLMRRGWPDTDVLVVDECFPAGTLIDGRPIEDIRPGDMVWSWNHGGRFAERKPVLRVMRKMAYKLLSIHIEGLNPICCTENHPFFNGEKYVEAKDLKVGSVVYGFSNPGTRERKKSLVPKMGCLLRYLRQALHASAEWIRNGGERKNCIHMLQPSLQGKAEAGSVQTVEHGDASTVGRWAPGTDEDQQSNGESQNPREGCAFPSQDRAQTSSPGREWGDHQATGRTIQRPWRGLGVGVPNPDRNKKGEGRTHKRQGGYCQSGSENCYRSGWGKPRIIEGARTGPEERGALAPVRVVAVEVQEPRRELRSPGDGCDGAGIDVFNFEVEGNNNYFAEGILVHNCHSLYRTWVDHIASDDCKAFVIGMTATAFTRGLGKVFTKLINAATMHDLTEQGFLVPMRVFSCRKPDMKDAETKADGEWTDKAAEERELVIVGDVVSEWSKFANGRKTICFGSTILHCHELAKQFNEAGIPAGVICADTPDDERARLFEAFRWGDLLVLVSVEALAKGFDQKDIGCVCDCRPLRKSLSTAIQMWGRGLRSCPESNKEDSFLLDFSGNIIRFAEDFERVYFNGLDRLDDGEKLDREIRKDEDREPRPCPQCGHIPFARKCVACGFEAAPKSLVEHASGVMEEIPVLCGKKKLAENKMHLWAQVATYSLDHAKPGKDPNKRALALYREITGEWPPRGVTAHDCPRVEPTRNTISKIRSLWIAYAHRRTA